MRTLHLAMIAMLALSAAAWESPLTCPAGAKRFACHQLAMNAHLAVSGKVDLATAKALYVDACAQREGASCNNLGVLALVHPDLAADVDPKALFDAACKRLDVVACGNLRRLATHPDLAIQLSLRSLQLAQPPARWPELERAACRAGDPFRCEDSTSRARVAALLAEECLGGVHTTCFDAATRATDPAMTAKLFDVGCTAGDGKACHTLATSRASAGASESDLVGVWKHACSDKHFDLTEADASARSDACGRWGAASRKRAEQRSAAAIAAGYCAAGKAGACEVAERLYDRAGDHARAFSIVKPLCEADEKPASPACRDLAERYLLGNGTTANIPRALALFGDSCPTDLSWESCKRVGRYLESKGKRLDAAAEYEPYCTRAVAEACYLRARAIEDDRSDETCNGKPGLRQLKAMYDGLCAKSYRDSCRRSASMCARAMADYDKPAECGWGVGDGVERLGARYRAVVELCEKAAWTPAIRKAMAKVDAYCRDLEGFGGGCER